MSESPRAGEGVNTPTTPVRAEFDWTETTPSTAVVEALAAGTGRTPTAVPPLYDSLDPDSLDDLFRSATVSDCEVSFTHDGLAVTVAGDGTVTVRRPDGTRQEGPPHTDSGQY